MRTHMHTHTHTHAHTYTHTLTFSLRSPHSSCAPTSPSVLCPSSTSQARFSRVWIRCRRSHSTWKTTLLSHTLCNVYTTCKCSNKYMYVHLHVYVIINPRRACAARVIVVVPCVCVCVCLSVITILALQATRRPKSDTNGLSAM